MAQDMAQHKNTCKICTNLAAKDGEDSSSVKMMTSRNVDCETVCKEVFAQEDALADDLETLSCHILQSICQRDYASPIFTQFCADMRFKNMFETIASLRASSVRTLGALQQLQEPLPKFTMDIIDTCADSNCLAGRATVWLTGIATAVGIEGYETIFREVVFKLQWRRNWKGWRCVKFIGLGFSQFSMQLPHG
jgi:hypothetical protein